MGSTVSGVILLIIVECVVEVILLVCWKRCRHDPEVSFIANIFTIAMIF